jgi:hypothetical protein
MRALPIEVVRDEVISLISESAQECQNGATQSELSLLLEAQFLLCELIQNHLTAAQYALPLSPPADEFSDENVRGLFSVASSGPALQMTNVSCSPS